MSDYVDLEELLPDYICTTCGSWVDENELGDSYSFKCPDCGVSTSKHSEKLNPREWSGRGFPYRQRTVVL